MSLQQPNSFRNGPDERGHFGLFGGRFVAETLMPLILELEKAYARGQGRPRIQARDGLLSRSLCRPSLAALFRRTLHRPFARRLRRDRRRRRGQDLLQARRAQPHRRAQGEQRARPDHGGQAHGQAADHRGDRRRPARRRHRDPVRAIRPEMHRLYGRRRCRAAGAQRVPHEDAGRRGAAGAVGRRRPSRTP